jgi:hypothetical protein
MSEHAVCSLVQAGADQLGHLGLHQLLGEQLETVAQELGVGALLGLAQQVE